MGEEVIKRNSTQTWFRSWSSPVSVFGLLIWFGLLSGFGEVAILVFRKSYQHRMFFISHHYPWTIPTGDVILFLVVGSIVYLIFSRQTVDFRFSALILVMFCLVFLSWLLHVNKLEVWASIILSAGLAVAAMRLILQKISWFNFLVRLTLPLFAFTYLVILIGFLKVSR